MDLILAVGFLAMGAAAGAGVVLMYRSLENKIREQERRIIELAQASDKRHLPYAVAEEIEDAEAAILSLIFDTDVKLEKARNALGHLKNARNNRKAKPER